MSYDYTKTFGSDVILAPCLQQLCEEIKNSPKYRVLTNLGEIGDSRHKGQGTGSDHNPFIVHNGKGYVRAIDLGGDRALLLELRAELHKLYVKHDPRVYPYGYFKGPDSLINDWFGNGWHVDTGDEGHLHISVNQANGNNPSSGGWVNALDSRASWGIGKAAPVKPITIDSPYPYRFKLGHVIGLKSNPSARVHGGINATERRINVPVIHSLRLLGFFHGKLGTDEITPEVVTAIRTFQRSRGAKKPTGTVGVWTWRALRKAVRELNKKKAAK